MDTTPNTQSKPAPEQWFVFRENTRIAGPMSTQEANEYANDLRRTLMESKSKDAVSVRQSLVG